MEIKFISDGKYLNLEPESERVILKKNHFHVHAAHHIICRELYAKQKQETKEKQQQELKNNGLYIVRNCIASDEANQISKMIDDVIEHQIFPMMDIVPFGELRRVLVSLLPQIFQPMNTLLIENYLGSYFRVAETQLYRTQMGSGQTNISCKWHRDAAPMAQLHLLLYLTSRHQHDPGTQILSLSDTLRMAKYGYSYGPFDERLDDLSTVLPKDAPLPEIIDPEFEAGDAIIFSAPRMLHKGLIGHGNYRDVFLLTLLPSFIPWQEDIEHLGTEHLFPEEKGLNTLQGNPFSRFFDENGKFDNHFPHWVVSGALLPDSINELY